jgi:hypothetical protein
VRSPKFPNGTEARLKRKEHHASFITSGSCQLRGAVRSGFFASVEDKSRYLSVIWASGCETIVMNQTALKQRPERIPMDPEHRSYSRNATAAVAIDSLLQNGGRLEHDDATRRSRHLGGGLRIAADTLTFPVFSCHSSVSLQFWNPDYREMRIAA